MPSTLHLLLMIWFMVFGALADAKHKMRSCACHSSNFFPPTQGIMVCDHHLPTHICPSCVSLELNHWHFVVQTSSKACFPFCIQHLLLTKWPCIEDLLGLAATGASCGSKTSAIVDHHVALNQNAMIALINGLPTTASRCDPTPFVTAPMSSNYCSDGGYSVTPSGGTSHPS